MYRSTEDNDSAIANISSALDYRPDELVLARGGSFAEFQEVAIRAWDGAPLGDESGPESCRTDVVSSRQAA